MDIDHLLDNPGDSGYYSDGFRILVRSFIPLLKTNFTSATLLPSNQDACKYAGDLAGYLDKNNIHKQHHYVVMLFNDYTSMADFNKDTEVIYIPDLNEIDLMYQVYSTSTSIIG